MCVSEHISLRACFHNLNVHVMRMHSAQISEQMAVVLLLFVLREPISCWNLALLKQRDKLKGFSIRNGGTPSEVGFAFPAK